MKAFQQLFCSREYQLTSKFNQQNEKYIHEIIYIIDECTTLEWDRGTALVQTVGKASVKG